MALLEDNKDSSVNPGFESLSYKPKNGTGSNWDMGIDKLKGIDFSNTGEFGKSFPFNKNAAIGTPINPSPEVPIENPGSPPEEETGKILI
tara:strand:- start:240 stop:509 length:270 start_codon:yes stop_codon:yes gene_type:complete